MGLSALTYGATIEGFGLAARGQAGDVFGDIEPFRAAVDSGTSDRIRELSPDSPREDLERSYTVQVAMDRVKAAREAGRQ